jgi:hypothetical protein
LVGGTNTSSSSKGDDAAAALAAAAKAWDGVLVFDECHKAKNFAPGKEAQSTKVGHPPPPPSDSVRRSKT